VTNLLCGEAAEEEGRYQEAETEYDEVVLLEPGNSWGFLKRALLMHRTGRAAKAREDLAEVLALAPGNPEATELAREWGAGKGWKASQGPAAVMKGAKAYLGE
jgi:tetratricopeptide (TPR) repeat protein